MKVNKRPGIIGAKHVKKIIAIATLATLPLAGGERQGTRSEGGAGRVAGRRRYRLALSCFSPAEPSIQPGLSDRLIGIGVLIRLGVVNALAAYAFGSWLCRRRHG